MKRIGILTYWGVANYGAWTQAYALNKLLTNMCGDTSDVKHIAYLEQSHWDSYYGRDKKGMNNFYYNWNKIPHIKCTSVEELENIALDVLITGADSIWEEIATGAYNSDWHLIGNGFKNCNKIISYAPSSGVFDGENGIPNQMIEGLKKYDAISVRDITTQGLVKKAIGEEADIVLDPALVWDFKKDDNVETPFFDNYIAVYGASWSDEFIKKVREYAKKNECMLISIGFLNDWCDISFRRIELRAFEWLGFFKKAHSVVTCTFHGLMLGLAFEKQVKFCQLDYVKNRSQTLMDILEIPNHGIDFDAIIDYKDIEKKLEHQQVLSYKWLWNLLEND